jgi:hypothetical protein
MCEWDFFRTKFLKFFLRTFFRIGLPVFCNEKSWTFLFGKFSEKNFNSRFPKKIFKKNPGHQRFKKIFVIFKIDLPIHSWIITKISLPLKIGGSYKRGVQTPISTQNARFAKRPVLKKPCKTPGFHPGHIQRPLSQRSPFRHSYDLG